MSVTGTNVLDAAADGDFWWYADAAVQIRLNGAGTWYDTTADTDPNGRVGWRLDLAGPDAPPGTAPVLRHGANRVEVRITGNTAVVDTGIIYVGTYGLWLDPYDPFVLSAVLLGCGDADYAIPPEPDPLVGIAIQIAQDILGPLSGFAVHPAGAATDEFRAIPRAHRLTPALRPLRTVAALSTVDGAGVETPLDAALWRVTNRSVYVTDTSACTGWGGFTGYSSVYGDLRYSGLGGLRDRHTAEPVTTLRLRYTFGSTINAAARYAILALARQLWLACTGSADCALPERVQSINREGISMTLIDPMTYLDKGRTGLPSVDLWLRTVSPGSGARINTPDSPPAVNIAYRVDAPLTR